MLGLGEIRAALDVTRFAYKPGWRFDVYQHRYEGVGLIIHMQVIDAQTGEPTLIPVPTFLPPIPDEAYLHHWLLDRVIRLETHEAREFYKVDGRMWSNPHAGGADTERW